MFSAVLSFWRKHPKMAVPKTKLSFQIETSDYNRLRLWADRTGQTVSELARNALLAAIPPDEKHRMLASGEAMTVLDRAFQELDETDNNYLPGVFPMPPIRKSQGAVPTEAERTHPAQRVIRTALTQITPKVPPGPHPCVHLDADAPPNMQGQCQGSCHQQQQRGKPCYYAPTVARECRAFEPKTKAGEAP